MRSFNAIVKIGLLGLIFFAWVNITSAQFVDLSNAITVDVLPAHPKAHQDVSLTLRTLSLNLDTSDIAWFVDSKLTKAGRGEKNLKITTGELGVQAVIEVIIKTSEGGTITNSFTVTPADVDLVWQAESYVPPFYKGKALYPYQGELTVIALPNLINKNGVRLNPSKLIYKWKKDKKLLNAESGYGKQSFTYRDGILVKPTNITVEVSSEDGTLVADGAISVEPTSPAVYVYEDNPLYGVRYEKAFTGNVEVFEKEINLVAVPYFFSAFRPDDLDLQYAWTVNDHNLPGDKNSNGITLRDEGEIITAKISLIANGIANTYQGTSGNFSLIFTKGVNKLFR